MAEHVPRDARPQALRADPRSKLVAMCLPAGEALALVPFVQDLLDVDGGDAMMGEQQQPGTRQPYAPSFVLPLADLEPPIANVIDLCFLDGFNDPVMAILHEPRRSWVGRKDSAASGAQLSIRTIDAIGKSYPSLASVDTLPLGGGHDALYLSPVPSTAGGGVLVVSANSITHVDGSGRAIGVAVNGWPALAEHKDVTAAWSHLELDLAGSHVVWVGVHASGSARALLVLADGVVYSLRLDMDGRAVSGMQFEPVGKVARPTSVTASTAADALFVGSAGGASEVWRCAWQEVERASEVSGEAGEDDMDDDDLYADSVVKTQDGAAAGRAVDVRLSLVRDDTLEQTGAVVDFAFGAPHDEDDGVRRPQLALLGTTSVSTIRPTTFDSETLDWPGTHGARRVWSVGKDWLAVALDDRVQMYRASNGEDVDWVTEHPYVALACGGSSDGHLVLVCQNHLLVLNVDDGTIAREIALDGAVASAFVSGDWTLAHLDDGTLRLFYRLERVEADLGPFATASLYCDTHLCTTNGARLEIRALPSLDVVFRCQNVDDCPALLLNGQTPTTPTDDSSDAITACQLHDLTVPTLTLLFASGELVVYETQSSPISSSSRFRKVLARTLPSSRSSRTLHTLDNELLITGSTLGFLLTRDRRHPAHLAAIDMDLQCLASHHGHYVAVTGSHVVSLRRHHRRSSHALPRDYTHITFDTPSGLYVAASTIATPFQLYSDECEIIEEPTSPHLTRPRMERSSLELLDPTSSYCAVDGHEFGENEVVLAIQSVSLEATSTTTGRRRFIAVATSINRGEDMASRGATYVFEVVPVVDVGHRLRLICSEDATASVTALANIGTYLVHAIGQKVYVKALDREDRLVAVAFLDVGAHVTTLRSFKNLLLVGDFIKSTWLCAFQEEPFKLEVLSRDLQDASTVSVDFMTSAEGHRAALVASDRDGVCRVLEYDPEHASSGDRLIRRAEYHLGSRVTQSSLVARRGRAAGEVDGVPGSQLLLSAADGSLSTLVPVRSARFKRLQLLQTQLLRSIPHVAGLNPRSNRTVSNDLHARPLNRGILDGPLLRAFEILPRHRQREICEPIGTTRETVLNDLVELAGLGSAWTWSF